LTLGQDTSGEIAPIGPPDDWEIWNKERNDSIYAIQEVSSPNLPGELKAYSPDFNRNGKWVYVAEYGNCWVPTVDVAADWAPYRNGRWIWRGGEYVWVGYEPWGWAPYHYGRWAFVDGVGWCWVPPASGEVYWSPGYVGWVKTGDYVAWVPLAPRETYYGRGYYGPHSVNVTNVNIAQVNVNVYKNVYVNNGVTVVNRSSFNTASPTVVHVNRNVIQRDIFLKKNINVAGPDIKPTRATYFGSGKIVPTAKMPPQHVREVSVRQLRESRPYVKEPGRSVMNRGAKPAPLPVIKNTEPRTPGQGKPAVKPVRPADKGKSIEPGPGPKAEHRGMIPPTVDKTGQPGSAPPTTPKFERKETISPVDKTKPVGPPSTPKGDHKEMMPPPIDKTKATAPSTAPKVERKEIMPPAVDKTRQTGPPPATTPKFERKEITPPPVDKAKPIVPPPAPKVERREITPPPAEKPKTLTPAPVPKVDRKETIQKPVEKPKPVAPVPAPAPAPKADKKAAETKDKGQKDKKKDDTNK
ncbi:MAG TPA: DUF6600 domain-containing protein, partial [Dissulfurispiraceae bacterium]|nr:DUF6600 domain-containing protein [Dissulfurispiraceae bacterium]